MDFVLWISWVNFFNLIPFKRTRFVPINFEFLFVYAENVRKWRHFSWLVAIVLAALSLPILPEMANDSRNNLSQVIQHSDELWFQWHLAIIFLWCHHQTDKTFASNALTVRHLGGAVEITLYNHFIFISWYRKQFFHPEKVLWLSPFNRKFSYFLHVEDIEIPFSVFAVLPLHTAPSLSMHIAYK